MKDPVSPPAISDIEVEREVAGAEVGVSDGQAESQGDNREGQVGGEAADEEVPPVPDASELGKRQPRAARRPYQPTKAEIDEHLPLNFHYRSWCPHCNAG